MHLRTTARQHRGQTLSLIETLVIVAIIAILASILIPKYLTIRSESQVAGSQATMKNVATALEMYYSINQSYPSSGGVGGTTVTANLFGGAGNNYYNGTPTSPNGGGSYRYNASGASPAYYIDDSGVYLSYLLNGFPKTAAGSDVSTGNCNNNCTHIEYNPDIGFTGN